MGVCSVRSKRLIVAAAMAILALWIQCSLVIAADDKGATWANVTANVGGEKWGYAGVTLLAAASDEVIAGVSESGLWSSADGGKSWRHLGEKDAAQIQNRPYQILFDPKKPAVFWESGNYKGPGLFKTTDGGHTFAALGNLTHLDGVGIDFTDPERKTIVVCHHEQERSVELSTDGGQTWKKIGDKLPQSINFSSDVIAFDGKTFVVNAAGWKQENGKQLPFGIFRTEDAGGNWTKVSDSGPGGIACVTANDVVYWQTLWAAGLIESSDKGKTWQPLHGPVRANPVEAGAGRLLAPVDKQLYLSTDAGKTWKPVGPELPFKPSGIVYHARSHAVFAWRSTETKEDNVIARWEMP